MIYTIGHSTREYREFVALLKEHGIQFLADVRSFPGSRRYPWFGKEFLDAALKEDGITYIHIPELGGRRVGNPASPHTGWRHKSFRAYADHMETAEFATGLAKLLKVAEQGVTVFMCSEAVPWRCHRSILSDALLVRGIRVVDIIGPNSRREHALTLFAVTAGLALSYPGREACWNG